MYILCTSYIHLYYKTVYIYSHSLGGATDSLATRGRALDSPTPPPADDSLTVLTRDGLEEEEGGAREFPWVGEVVVVGGVGGPTATSESSDREWRTVVV